jgi:hypothetical protein
MTVCVGRRTNGTTAQVLLEHGDTFSNPGIISITEQSIASVVSARSNGSLSVTANSASTFPPGVVQLLTLQSKISTDLLSLAVNRNSAILSGSDQGTGNYSSRVFNLGSRNQSSFFFNGHLNSGFIINRILNPLVLADYERYWVAKRSGIDLP